MIHYVSYEDKTLEFDIVRSNRIKTSEIIVEAGKVVVRTPSGKDIKEIEKMVKRKAEWIARKQQEYQALVLQISKPSFEPDSTLPYLGKNYALRVFTGYKANKIRLVRDEFLVSVMSSEPDKKQLSYMYEDWLMERAGSILVDKVRRYSEQLGVNPKKVVIKNMRKRWGSATKDNVLNLNVNLLKAPEDVIDYIVLHELCHLKIRNHSHYFWELVDRFMPNYKQKAQWLSANFFGLVE